jgi:hypothetical protein
MILAIDPGPYDSAYVILDDNLKPVEFGKEDNNSILDTVLAALYQGGIKNFAVEMVASYGMAVGKEVFETCVWIGRFWETSCSFEVTRQFIYRKDEKMNLCHSMKANDSNIRQALIDRFGPVGTKKNPGWFYGVSKDVWAAIAVGVTYHDLYLKEIV